jgi:hypothetical protein
MEKPVWSRNRVKPRPFCLFRAVSTAKSGQFIPLRTPDPSALLGTTFVAPLVIKMWSWLAFPFHPALGQGPGSPNLSLSGGACRIAQKIPKIWSPSCPAVRLLQLVYPPLAPLDLRMLVPAGPGTSRRTHCAH